MNRNTRLTQKNAIIALVLITVAAAIALFIQRGHQPTASELAFEAQADLYFDHFYIPSDPAMATALGIHQYDGQLEDMSKSAINGRIDTLKEYEQQFARIDKQKLNLTNRNDLDLVLNNIRGRLLTLEKIKPWAKNPDLYTSIMTYSAFVLISREFAAPAQRLKSLIAREKQMPALLQNAKKNLHNPPKIYTQIAIEQLPGIIHFFQKDVPAAFSRVQNPELLAEFKASNAKVVRALKQYQTWLKTDLLPRAHGDYRIGKENYRLKLKYDEMVDTPLDDLLAMNAANMHKNQQALVRVAKLINPSKTPQQVLHDIHHDHPEPDKLLATFKGEFDDLIRFLREKQIITIPSDVRPIMEETPPFLRSITFASMDTPGPFEKHATEAYFNVTLPDPAWSKEKTQEFMAQFNYASINSIAAHETYPGHYVQFLWLHNVHNRVRKLLGAASNAEGWAHYAEQMILDEGFGRNGYGGKSQKDAAKLRLGQLQEALLRNARFVVGIKLHTGQMTFEQAINYFVKEGKQTRHVGLVETKRATSDPTYLYYTLGKLQIQQLRRDMENKLGAKFNLKQFHDDFMRQGYPPIAIVRKAMLQTRS